MQDVSTSGERGAFSWRRVWRRPDPVLADAGRQSELVVAQVRVAVTVLLLLVPFSNLFTKPEVTEHRVGMAVTIAAFLAAVAVWVAVRRDRRPVWLGAFSTVFDVSLVSAALLTYVVTGQPLIATNSRVVFEAYFLAIAATCLRYDVRLCLLAGALSIGQYVGILFLATGMYDLDSFTDAIQAYGYYDVSSEVSRVILLGIASALSAVIVYRARDLRRLSAIDRMTGLFNRGHFDERYAAELSRARRLGRPLSVVMLDVDHFKDFNDRHGHAAGDLGLRAVADCVRLMTRRSDVVARYGGEEFVLLLPDTDPALALDKLEEIREAVARLVIELPRGAGQARLTVSAGIATFPDDSTEGELLLDEADARLFRAKADGRNRVLGRPGGVVPAWSRAS